MYEMYFVAALLLPSKPFTKKKKQHSNRVPGSLSKSFLALNNCLENVRAVASLGNYVSGCQLPIEHSGALTNVWRDTVDHLGLATSS